MVPRLGGASFFPTFLFAFTLTMGMRYIFGYDVADDYFMDSLCELMFLLAGSTVLFCVGMADDLTGVGYKGKFLAQTFWSRNYQPGWIIWYLRDSVLGGDYFDCSDYRFVG